MLKAMLRLTGIQNIIKSKAYKHTIKMIAKITKYIKANQTACFCSKNSWLAYESWPLVPRRLYHMTNKRKGGLHK